MDKNNNTIFHEKKFYIIITFLLLICNLIPLPLQANITPMVASAAQSVKLPTANPKQGSYLDKKTITLSCKTKGAIIYYTTDGKRPTSSSKKYTKPFTIKKDCFIRAIAIKGNSVSDELIYYYDIYSYKDISDDVERFELAIKNDNINKLTKTDQVICKKVMKVIKDYITDNMTDYEKIKTIHDYIINNNVYDYDNYVKDTIPSVSYTIEGVLLNGTAVCQGYAETFQLFMNLIGIKSKLVYGYGDGVSHAWNMVYLNGSWYHIDTTWDDPVSETNEQSIRYNYFLINDEQLMIDHEWITSDYPKSENDEMMYEIFKDNIISSIANYESKFKELYNKGNRTITVLYPENSLPNMSFYPIVTGSYNYSYYIPEKFGDYYIFTVIIM